MWRFGAGSRDFRADAGSSRALEGLRRVPPGVPRVERHIEHRKGAASGVGHTRALAEHSEGDRSRAKTETQANMVAGMEDLGGRGSGGDWGSCAQPALAL